MVCSMERIVFPVIFSKPIRDFPLPPNDAGEDKAWSSSFWKDKKQRQFCFTDSFFFCFSTSCLFLQRQLRNHTLLLTCPWDASSLECRGQNTDAPALGGTHVPWLSKSGLEMLKKTIVLKAGEEKENVHEGLNTLFPALQQGVRLSKSSRVSVEHNVTHVTSSSFLWKTSRMLLVPQAVLWGPFPPGPWRETSSWDSFISLEEELLTGVSKQHN